MVSPRREFARAVLDRCYIAEMNAARSLVLFGVLVAFGPALVSARSCESLSAVLSPKVFIAVAETVNGGAFTPAESAEPLRDLPPFCRLVAKLKPTADSDIGTEIWLPVSGWNSKYLAVGSGGWGGYINYAGMAEALRRGYATSATDDGHTAVGAAFIMGHPEKFIDFAYRADHEMTVEAKAMIKALYGSEAQHAYWHGCSGGGREGLIQAYRYPSEFDGIIVGDPANMRRNAWALWLATEAIKDPAAFIPPAKYAMIHQAVLAACDAQDGLKDGLIEEPERCRVDFKSLECRAADAPDCLTSRQVQTAQIMISPATTSTGRVLFPRLEPGTELRWARLAGDRGPADLFLDQFRYVVYQDPGWDWRRFDLERDFAKANAVDKDIDELDTHLAAFEHRGGKLLIYHGWADQQVPPGSSVEFYRSALKNGAEPAPSPDWIRLFMAPGMAHCSGGEGPDTFDTISVMEQWVEHGTAPRRILAAHFTAGKLDRTRPLCPYPQVARYAGKGSIDEAANFNCRSVVPRP